MPFMFMACAWELQLCTFELAQHSIETASEPQDGRKILRYTLQLFAALISVRRQPRTTLHVHRLMFFEISTPDH
jgi:hypothetical protein